MPDTLNALDTASTDELIAALRSRLRATLGQSCGHLEDLDMMYSAADGIGMALAMRMVTELRQEMSAYVSGHPALTNAPPEKVVRLAERLLREGLAARKKFAG